MQKIFRLDPHVADLIAAGEVVERPSSVVRELIENAIDAGSTVLTVEIRGGGLAAIRVTDNGCGMSAQDAQTAFLRHATSKLRDARGLEAIGTLGFRGEALAAIAAVSRVDLSTRERGADEGTTLHLEGGAVLRQAATGCPDGTTICVQDLFYNTPARLKFMKSDRAEGAAVTAMVLRCALSRPDVSVRYIRDGSEEFHTPGDGRVDSCIYSLLGREFFSSLLPVETENSGVTVTGYVSSPANVRGNRSSQFFFVNGRCIKSKTLQAALEQAYRNRLPVSRYPACILYIAVSKAAVDVNVHPAKTEVRFLNERQVFDAVYYAALGALDSESHGAAIHLSAGTEKVLTHPAPVATPHHTSVHASAPVTQSAALKKAVATPSGTFYKKMSAEQFSTFLEGASGKSSSTVVLRNTPNLPYQTRLSMPERPTVEPAAAAAVPPAQGYTQAVSESAVDMPSFRLIGEAMCTYILVEQGDKLIVIDKHAAHERMLFNQLKTGHAGEMQQLLLEPVVCKLGAENAAILAENAAALASAGIEAEDFGGGSVIVRQVPADIDAGDIPAMMEDLCAALAIPGGQPEARSDRVLHTVACKAAIKAGKRSAPEELMAIARAVLSGQVRYCPHGRPVSMELTKDMLDKNFKRI
jgi:DNA mismatch repair protein MutL